MRDGFHAGAAQCLGLRLAPAFGDGLGEVGEKDGEPEPDGELRDETAVGVGGKNPDGGQHCADQGHEHDGIFDHQARVELFEGVAHRRAGDVPIEKGWGSMSHKSSEFSRKRLGVRQPSAALDFGGRDGRTPSESARGLAQSKTWRRFARSKVINALVRFIRSIVS